MPEVSIIIPIYNKEKYIRKTIESIIYQTYKDYEVIFVDDGSTDCSAAIIYEYLKYNDRFKYFKIDNSGVSNARNVGISKASGKWIQFLDGDDIIDETYLQQAVDIAENSEADILFSEFRKTDELGKVVGTIQSPCEGKRTQIELINIFMEYQYKTGFFGFISNKLISRAFIEKSKARFPVDISLAEDLYFYVQLYSNVENVMFTNINSFYYLQTETNYITNENIDYRSQMCIHLKIADMIKEKNLYNKYKSIIDAKISDYAYFILFHDNENTSNIKDGYEYCVSNERIMDAISSEYSEGFEKQVLNKLSSYDYKGMERLFSIRNAIRKIYRRIRK